MKFLKSKFFRALVLAPFCLLLASVCRAQLPDAQLNLYAGSLSATCAGCHGTGGRAVTGSPVGSLAGLDKTYFVQQMNAFKAGTRPATVMHQISKGFTDLQIGAMATYFAAQHK